MKAVYIAGQYRIQCLDCSKIAGKQLDKPMKRERSDVTYSCKTSSSISGNCSTSAIEMSIAATGGFDVVASSGIAVG